MLTNPNLKASVFPQSESVKGRSSGKKPRSYYDKLRDPRWQKKRLEVLDRIGFTCSQCGDSESELHVHHAYYLRGRDPWEYPDEALSAVCGECHERLEADRVELLKASSETDPHILVGVCWAMDFSGPTIRCETWGHAEGIGLVFGLRADDVIAEVVGNEISAGRIVGLLWREFGEDVPRRYRRLATRLLEDSAQPKP